MENQNLFGNFPPVSTKEWKAKIIEDLKGADFDKKLVWKNAEQFEVAPFYRSEDLGNLALPGICPGDFPFLRGKRIKQNNWLIRQDIDAENIEQANAKALDVRLKGVDSLGFTLKNEKPSVELIDRLLQNIRADIMELNFISTYPLEIIKSIDVLTKKYNRDLDKIKGSVDADPLGFYSVNGKFRTSREAEFTQLEQLVKAAKHLPNFQVITVDGGVFHNSGSGIVTQLAFTLAKAVEYLNYLTGKGFDIDEIASKIRFHFAVGSSYFMEIAKFRAARYLWSHIVNAYGLNEANHAAMFIHCTSSQWNKTAYDPYVNMLRTTTETMSATIGGVDSMTVLPFDAVYEQPSEFSERIARNQQLLLKNESYFDQVNDPAAGSYYIEELTMMIIDESWKLFLSIDEQGGFLNAFDKGFIQEKIDQEAAQKDLDIAKRKRILLGTNQYPDTSEYHKNFVPFGADNNRSVLNPYRGAQAFETLRQKTDQYALKKPRPRAWMFTYGNLAMRNARAQFAANFFGCAGFEIVNNVGFTTIEKGIAAAEKSHAEIVVICSSDEEYNTNALKIFDALKDHTIVVLAGYPKDLAGQLQTHGFEHFIHSRSNVLEALKKFQLLLGIK